MTEFKDMSVWREEWRALEKSDHFLQIRSREFSRLLTNPGGECGSVLNPPLSSFSVKQLFVYCAADSTREPKLPDAAHCTNGY